MEIKGYDQWRMTTPWDDCHDVGTEEGHECGRVAEPDEDAPRGYRAKPCTGTMVEEDGEIVCLSCGELA